MFHVINVKIIRSKNDEKTDNLHKMIVCKMKHRSGVSSRKRINGKLVCHPTQAMISNKSLAILVLDMFAIRVRKNNILLSESCLMRIFLLFDGVGIRIANVRKVSMIKYKKNSGLAQTYVRRGVLCKTRRVMQLKYFK